MAEGLDLVLDRRPDGVGLSTHDWAGMQVSRLWALPLFEAEADSGAYQPIGAVGIERQGDLEWLIELDEDRVGSASRVLDEWRASARVRGLASFFFMSSATVEHRTALRLRVRASYTDIRPFLDAFDLWVGLSDASTATANRRRGPRCDSYERPDGSTVRVMADRCAERLLSNQSWVASGLPASSALSDAISSTLLTFVTVPIGSRRALSAVSGRELENELDAAQSAVGGFERVANPVVCVDSSAQHGEIEYACFAPNGDIARAICGAVESRTDLGVLVPRTTAYREQADQMFGDGLALTVVVPMNTAATGLTRTLSLTPWIARSGLVPRGAFADAVREAESGRSERRHSANAVLTTAAGVGFVARYRAGRSNNHGWDPPVSQLGILPLEDLEPR